MSDEFDLVDRIEKAISRAVTEEHCKERRESSEHLCQLQHRGIDKIIDSMDKKINWMFGLVALNLLGVGYNIYFRPPEIVKEVHAEQVTTADSRPSMK